MEILLRKFCLKTAEFLEQESMKIRSKLGGGGVNPDVMDYNTFKHAANALNALGYELTKEDSPYHDMKMHLGNLFGFTVKE